MTKEVPPHAGRWNRKEKSHMRTYIIMVIGATIGIGMTLAADHWFWFNKKTGACVRCVQSTEDHADEVAGDEADDPTDDRKRNLATDILSALRSPGFLFGLFGGLLLNLAAALIDRFF